MQRHNSFTSLHSLLSSRSSTSDYVRDSSTSALLDDRKFAKRLRKVPAASPRPTYNFPNGETFTPRTAPSKRNKPARLATYPNRPSAKAASMVLANSPAVVPASLPHPHSHSRAIPNLKHSRSFSNLKEKSKQSLMDSIRTNTLDTPTNIVLPAKNNADPVPSRHSHSLTNNRYSENSSNIIRNVLLVSGSLMDTSSQLRFSTLDSDPSSISNYNISGSNTPQTSVSGSEVASDMLRLEGSTESVSSYNNAKETCSLESIKEFSTSDFPPALDSLQSPAALSSLSSPSSNSNNENMKNADSVANADESASGASYNSESTSVQIIPLSTARSLAKAGKECSGSSSSSGSSYRSFSEADDVDNVSHEFNASDGDSLTISEGQTKDDQEDTEGNDPTDDQREDDAESTGPSYDQEVIPEAIAGAAQSEWESKALKAENDSLNSGAVLLVNGDKLLLEAADPPQITERVLVVADHRRSTADLPEPTIMLEAPARDTYLKVGLRGFSERAEGGQIEEENVKNFKGLTLQSTLPAQKPADLMSGPSTPLPENSVPPTPISKNSVPPTPIEKTTAPPTPISKDSVPATPTEAVSDRADAQGTRAGETSSKPLVANSNPALPKTNYSEIPKSSTSFSSGDSHISVRKDLHETQQPVVQYRSMLFEEPESTKKPELSLKGKKPLLPAPPKSILPEQLPAQLPEAPSPISKDLTYNQQIDPIRMDLIVEVNEKGGSANSKLGGSTSVLDDFVSLDGTEYYSPVQIDKFFADQQVEVPPRGDLDVNNGFIKVHKRNNSSISSAQSMKMKASPLVPQKPQMSSKETPSLPRHSPIKKPFTPTAARYSMLAVVDVDYDKSLPGTPSKDKRVTRMQHEFQSSLSFDVETSSKASLTDTVTSSPAASPEKKSMLKKFSKFLSSGTKEKYHRKLNYKSLNSSMNAPASKRSGFEPTNKDGRNLDRTWGLKGRPSPLEKGRKRGLFLNLKLGSSQRVDDLPSPVYSVRDKLAQGESQESSPTATKFDLPNYEVERDDFNDVLMRFDEVEKEVEKDIIQLRKGHSLHDFFAKDDELTNDQIVDQKRKDNHQSEESLMSKFSSANSSYESVSAAEAKQSLDDSYSGITDDIIAQMKSEETASEFPPRETEKIVLVTRQQLQSAYNEPKGSRRSYFHLAKQFSDYPEVEIKLKGFEPFEKSVPECDVARPNSSALEKHSILKSDSAESKGATRSVKFSNTISISETYAPYMYKRNNKAVTQYYVNDLNEISKIKNELNAFKCYEMLVHEKSQTNTQFFY